MELKRVCNAGVLLKLDGVSILLDGLCEGLEGYLATPEELVEELRQTPPDLLAFTHNHPDHCSSALLLPYRTQKLRPIFGPESLPAGKVRVGEVTVTAVETRHLGKSEPGLMHHSFVIEGSKCIWFMGDASPMQMKKMAEFPKPDVLIVPYAYANTPSAWEMTKAARATTVVLLHLPEKEKDPFALWRQVKNVTEGECCLWIPEVGETRIV
jgi:L-ascorbate metabolism protein UlaG (beta-lactamase superfamily)